MNGKIKKEDNNIEVSAKDSEQVIPVIREEVVTGTKVVKKASILIRRIINTEEVTVDIPVKSDHYETEHIPKNEFVDSRPEIRQEGETTIIPVIKEVLVKKLLLTEEIRITRKVQFKERAKKITLKKEEVKITRKEF